MAEKIFDITDNEILSAIECHTTLKGKYSQLDLVVFVANKNKLGSKRHSSISRRFDVRTLKIL